jgi:hypothetical protein
MGFNVRVPGGWIGTRSSGVRLGPFSAAHTYKRRRSSSSDLNLIGSLIVLAFYLILAAAFVAFYILRGLVWVLWQLARILWWLICTPFRLLSWPFRRHHRRKRIARAFATPPTGPPVG